ncbi:MAG: 4Fe-4S dicluster domain-containing protein [Bacteroidales bacterium]|nr:4Fe-4S dicluster domain-containing protein [Bacteroidales bacterium]
MEQKLFDTNVQWIKYKVLKEVIRRAYEGGLENAYVEIPKIIVPGPKAELRCCIYKERAVVQERIHMAMGGNKENPNPVQVMETACDECPAAGMMVTDACRGCMMHACKDVCPKDAITIVGHRCVIDRSRCIECGRCAQACPYSAIIAQKRPCMKSCKVKAISINSDDKAVIDNNKCISCGACVYKCPFGAISDRSLVLDIIDILKNSDEGRRYRVYAVVAPAIVSQCRFGRVTQVVTAIRRLGFHQVVEAALGADITLYNEALEFAEKTKADPNAVMTTSCCPAFVSFVEKNFPELKGAVSSSVSPMVMAARLIKSSDPTAKVVFIGPCAAKKGEYTLEKTKGLIDSVMSFEELQAFVDARGIVTTECEDTELDNASYYGRIFAKSGGVAQGVAHVAQELGVEGVRSIAMNGIDQCRTALTLLRAKKQTANFFEGMACDGGCIGGPLCITHSPRNIVDVDEYGNQAKEKGIGGSVELYKLALRREGGEK